MDPPTAGGLREPDIPQLLKQRARLRGNADRVSEIGALLWVEVDAQLVGVVEVLATDRPRVKSDRAHLRGPADYR